MAFPFIARGEAAAGKFVFERAEMGVPWRITIYGEDAAKARVAADAAFDKVRALNAVFSDYEDDSEVVRLSRTHGQQVKVSEHLWVILERSQKLAAATDGAFDITCGPLTALWRRARRKMELPSPEIRAEMLARCGWKKLRLDATAKTAELLAPDMRLDLGAIAKGYSAREAFFVLKEHGFSRVLVSAGGDMFAGEPPPGQEGWRIEVAALDTLPPVEKPPGVVVRLANQPIATSGDLFQRLEIGGKRYSHIIDPRTGEPLVDHSLVTVIAKPGFLADGLSTVGGLIGVDACLKLVAEWNATARFQRQPGNTLEVRESADWPK